MYGEMYGRVNGRKERVIGGGSETLSLQIEILGNL